MEGGVTKIVNGMKGGRERSIENEDDKLRDEMSSRFSRE